MPPEAEIWSSKRAYFGPKMIENGLVNVEKGMNKHDDEFVFLQNGTWY